MPGMDLPALALALVALAAGAALAALVGQARLTRARTALAAAQVALAATTAERDQARASVEQLAARVQQRETDVVRLETQLAAEQEKTAYAETRLTERFRALSAEALAANNRQFLELADSRLREAGTAATGELEQRRLAVEHLVAPLKETLAKVEKQLHDLEQARLEAYARLTEQVDLVRHSSDQLHRQTAALVTALRAPQARGRWGEMQLRRVVEVAGMVEHCDFDEQVSVATADGLQRPDMVVRLAGGKNVVVDAKVSLAAYLEAAETTDEDVRTARLAAHARHLRDHVDALGAKAYWTSFSPAPEFVVLFVPGEAFLAPALEHDPLLLEQAMAKRVIVATPTTLITMLRTVAYAWQQAALTENARAVFELGRELYDRLGSLGQHVDRLGRALGGTVTAYNKAVGSLEGRVLVTARKLRDLKVVDGDLAPPAALEQSPRPLAATELLADAETHRSVRPLPPWESAAG